MCKPAQKENGPKLYHRVVVPDYGDIDCIIGKNAARDVFPLILAHLRSPSVQQVDTETPKTLGASSPTARL